MMREEWLNDCQSVIYADTVDEVDYYNIEIGQTKNIRIAEGTDHCVIINRAKLENGMTCSFYHGETEPKGFLDYSRADMEQILKRRSDLEPTVDRIKEDVVDMAYSMMMNSARINRKTGEVEMWAKDHILDILKEVPVFIHPYEHLEDLNCEPKPLPEELSYLREQQKKDTEELFNRFGVEVVISLDGEIMNTSKPMEIKEVYDEIIDLDMLDENDANEKKPKFFGLFNKKKKEPFEEIHY